MSDISASRIAHLIDLAEATYALACVKARAAYIELRALNELQDDAFGPVGTGFGEDWRVTPHMNAFARLAPRLADVNADTSEGVAGRKHWIVQEEIEWPEG